jgi:hypothetical protein
LNQDRRRNSFFSLGAKIMVNPENQKDKERFEKMKATELDHGRDEQKATEVAAKETRVLREREGRSKREQ